MIINPRNLDGWIRDSLLWWMDLDIEARINSQIDAAIMWGKIGFVPGGVFGPRIPRGVGFTRDSQQLRYVIDAMLSAPIVPRLVLLAHYWPVALNKQDVLNTLGISNKQYYKQLDAGLEHVSKVLRMAQESA